MPSITKAFLSKQFFLFLIAGAIAASINFFSRILYSEWLHFSAAVVLAYFTGMIFAFFLNRWFIFGPSGSTILLEKMRFFLVNVVAVWQTILISYLFLKLFEVAKLTYHQEEIAHLIGLAAPVFTSFIGHKYYTFGLRIMDKNSGTVGLA